MATLKEIAQAAHVSMATVSNVINGNHHKVSSETVERVEKLAREMGYVPNQAARSLAQRESRFIAIISQAGKGDNILTNPYNAQYIGALTVDLHEKGYYPLIRFTNDFKDIDTDLRGWNVAGAIFNGSYSRYLKQIRSLPSIPIVFTDCYFRVPGINHVGVDDDMGGQLAGEYLGKMGHRKVAFLAADLDSSEVDQHRRAGFEAGLKEYDVELPDRWTFRHADIRPGTEYTEALYQELYSAMQTEDRPTAFFCTSDAIALQLHRLMGRMSLRVPEDVSIIGFDDLPFTQQYSLPLTTIHQDVDQKAHLVVDMLSRHIQDKTLPSERTVVGVSLVERGSVRNLGTKEETARE
ncbi:MAG: LacI family DNA-binding transcriptional regulator [Clostridia bacterium]|nr:LacI family DNA-binding transcriptional regulator [Clostridia bacterium]